MLPGSTYYFVVVVVVVVVVLVLLVLVILCQITKTSGFLVVVLVLFRARRHCAQLFVNVNTKHTVVRYARLSNSRNLSSK